VTVTTGAGCAWTATSNESWLTIISGAKGYGDGEINYRVDANTGDAREAVVIVAGQRHYVQQAAAPKKKPRVTRFAQMPQRMGTDGHQ
jgi:hypothetical protein